MGNNHNPKRQMESICHEVNQNFRALKATISDLQYYHYKAANQLASDIKSEEVALQILQSAYTQPIESFVNFDFPKLSLSTELYGIIKVEDFIDLSEQNAEVKGKQTELDEEAYLIWEESYFTELQTSLLNQLKPEINKIISIVNKHTELYYYFKSISSFRIWFNNNNIETELVFEIDLK